MKMRGEKKENTRGRGGVKKRRMESPKMKGSEATLPEIKAK